MLGNQPIGRREEVSRESKIDAAAISEYLERFYSSEEVEFDEDYPREVDVKLRFFGYPDDDLRGSLTVELYDRGEMLAAYDISRVGRREAIELWDELLEEDPEAGVEQATEALD